MATFGKTSKGKECMHYQGYRYTKNKSINNTDYWTCANRNCTSKTITVNGILVKNPNDHLENCNPSVSSVICDRLKDNLRQRASSERTSLKRIYEEVTREIVGHELEDEIVACFPSFESSKTSMYKSRRKGQPLLPHNLQDLVVPDSYRITREGELFLLHDDGVGENRLLIFASHNNLRVLCRSTQIWMDGTFKSVPQIFAQLYTIHAMPYRGLMVPLIFCLLPNKVQGTYQRVLRLIKQSCLAIGETFNPQYLHIDFEEAVRRAISMELPNCNISGCFFHYCQCLWRKVQALGMVEHYNANSGNNDFRKWMRAHGALALIPLTLVGNLKQQLHHEFPDVPDIENFMDYFDQQWMATWPPSIWNHYNKNGPRTNNHLEGFHSKLNKHFTSAHPNIFLFLDTIVSFQSSYTLKIQQVAVGHNPPRPNSKYMALHHKLDNLKQQYIRGEKNAWELLQALAYHTGM